MIFFFSFFFLAFCSALNGKFVDSMLFILSLFIFSCKHIFHQHSIQSFIDYEYQSRRLMLLPQAELVPSVILSGCHQWAVAQSWCGSGWTAPQLLFPLSVFVLSFHSLHIALRTASRSFSCVSLLSPSLFFFFIRRLIRLIVHQCV